MVAAILPEHGSSLSSLLNAEHAYDISNSLMNVFCDNIGLWVHGCDRTALKPVVFATHIAEFCHEFCAMIKDDILW